MRARERRRDGSATVSPGADGPRRNTDDSRAVGHVVGDDGAGSDDSPAADAPPWGHASTDPDEGTVADVHGSGKHRSRRDVGGISHHALVLDDGSRVDHRPLTDGGHRVDDGSGHDEASGLDRHARGHHRFLAEGRDQRSPGPHACLDEPLARVVGADGDEHRGASRQQVGQIVIRAQHGYPEPGEPLGGTDAGGHAAAHGMTGLAQHLDAHQGMSTGADDEHRCLVDHAPTVVSRVAGAGGSLREEDPEWNTPAVMLFGTGMVEVAILIAVLAGAGAFGLWRRRTDGRISTAKPASTSGDEPTVTAAEIGHPLGERATLVQFSSAFCAPCRATRQVLGTVADAVPGVIHLEVDAEANLDLVRRLDVRRTPTTLVLDAEGREMRRAAGVPRNDEVLAALGEAVA